MLQGSLDNFALDEVLGLLAATTKTGVLDLTGSRGRGTLQLLDGKLVGASTSNEANGTEAEDVVFELLRFTDGTFAFEVGEVATTEISHDVGEILGSAEQRLADWRTIEAVVPSLRHTVTPVAALPDEEVTISRQEWATLVSIAGGCAVSAVCDDLDLGEVEGSRQIKGLAERGLVTIGDPRTGSYRRSSESYTPPAAAAAVGIDTSTEYEAAYDYAAPGPIEPEPLDHEPALAFDEPEAALVGADLPPPTFEDEGYAAPNGSENGNGNGSGSEERSGGGLLMRYLKGDD